MLKPLVSPEEWEQLRQKAMMIQLPRLLDPEQVDMWTSERQARVALQRSPLRPMPLVVLAHGRPDPNVPFPEQEERLLQQLQRELAQLVPGGRLVIATESGHIIQDDQPELVLDAIRDVVRAVRAGDLVPH